MYQKRQSTRWLIVGEYDAIKSINVGAGIVAMSAFCLAFSIGGLILQFGRMETNMAYYAGTGLWGPIFVSMHSAFCVLAHVQKNPNKKPLQNDY